MERLPKYDDTQTSGRRLKMAHAELCPVCNGKGRIRTGNAWTATGEGQWKSCHGCGGTGWITIQDPKPFIPQIHNLEEIKNG